MMTLGVFVPSESGGGGVQHTSTSADFDGRDFTFLAWPPLALPRTVEACQYAARVQGEMSALALALLWTGSVLKMDAVIGASTVRLARAIVRLVLPWVAASEQRQYPSWVFDLNAWTLATHSPTFLSVCVRPARLKIDRYWQSLSRKRSLRILRGACGIEVDAWVPS